MPPPRSRLQTTAVYRRVIKYHCRNSIVANLCRPKRVELKPASHQLDSHWYEIARIRSNCGFLVATYIVRFSQTLFGLFSHEKNRPACPRKPDCGGCACFSISAITYRIWHSLYLTDPASLDIFCIFFFFCCSIDHQKEHHHRHRHHHHVEQAHLRGHASQSLLYGV